MNVSGFGSFSEYGQIVETKYIRASYETICLTVPFSAVLWKPLRYFGLDRCGVMHGARKQDQREAARREIEGPW